MTAAKGAAQRPPWWGERTAWASGRRRAARWALALAAAAVAASVLLAPGWARWAARRWTASDPAVPADAVVVLGGGYDRRARAAAELYRRGLAPHVLVAELGPAADGATESELSRAVLRQAGVPAAAIAPVGAGVASTYDEARATAAWAAATGARQILVPTDAAHARRAKWVFAQVAPPGVAIAVLALAPDGRPAASAPPAREVAREAAKFIYYLLRYGFARFDPRAAAAVRPASAG